MKLTQPVWPRFLPTKWVVGIATLGPVGLNLPAPGTWGSLAGVLYFTVFFFTLSWPGYLVLAAAGLYVAVGLCGEAEVRMGRTDPGEVILDEFTAMPLCYLGWRSLAEVAPIWVVVLAGFGLFRLFDVMKPFGINRLQKLPGGWGVVIDDVAAALATCVVLHGLRLIWR